MIGTCKFCPILNACEGDVPINLVVEAIKQMVQTVKEIMENGKLFIH